MSKYHIPSYKILQISTSQRAAIAVDFKPLFAKEAKLRMAEGGRGGNISTPSKARDVTGKMMGVSGRSVDRAEKLKREDPKLFENFLYRNCKKFLEPCVFCKETFSEPPHRLIFK